MGGNRGSSKKAKSSSAKYKGWRNLPGSSKDSTAPLDDQEVHILAAGPSLETISSSETITPANEDHETEGGSSRSGQLRRKRKGAGGKIITGLLERTGLCLCVVYQCAGFSHKTCDLCNPRRMAGYQKMENEQYRADHREESAERDIDQYNSLLLNFYLDSPSVPEFSPLLVTRSMSTVDAIKGVALGRKTEDYHRYTIVEHWKEYEAERILEDHEIIQDVRREQVKFFTHKFVFLYRTELEKYEYIRNKEDFFIHPKDVHCINYKKQTEDPILIQVQDPFYSNRTNILTEPPFVTTVESSDNVVESSLTIQPVPEEVPEDDLVNPIFCGSVYVKESNKDMTIAEIEKLPEHREKAHWPKKYLLLRNRNLYFVDNHQNMLKFYYIDDQTFGETLETQEQNKKEKKRLDLIGPIADFQTYSGLNTKRYHSAPYGGGIYLKRHDGSSKKAIRLMFCCKNDKKRIDPNNFTRKLWLAAMRLAKHGTKIKENYLQYKTAIEEYFLRMKLLREANNPRVAMDFSFGVGRVVDDPKEAAEIARGEARGGSQKTTRFQPLTPAPLDSLRFGPHLTQCYYHRNLSREQAEEMIIRNGTNGAFILRDSKNRPGCLVITYMHALRAHHQYVSPVVMHDKVKEENIFLATCDKDTVFYDVHSLIEYHRLNKGSLQCLLTISIKNPLQPDGTPPRRHRSEQSNSRNSSPQAGTSKECTTLSTMSRDASASPQQINDPERERQILSQLQIGVDEDTSLRENPTTEPVAIKSTAPQVDLLTALEVYPESVDSVKPLSPHLSRSPRRGGTSSSASSKDGASPKSSPQLSHDRRSNSPRV